jgi:serine phosphatase RsbU (regulator of sigma subunit)
VPELKWYVVNAVDLKAAQVIDENWITTAVAALAVMFIVLVALFGYGVNRMILRPLNRLHHSATALSRGRYDAPLPSAQNDEIGDLSRAFAVMVDKIKNHTRQLEDKVRQRTRELEEQSRLLENAKVAAEEANNAKSEVLDNVMESIHYAQTIQQAILSTELQIKQFVPECFTLWRPKDVISGDMIWSKDQEDGFAIAVIDCTGHGVPGGIMTMAAVSVLNRVVSEFGLQRPHRILQEVSRIVQNMLGNQKTCRFSEDGLDMALCTYQRSWSTLFFAGARLGLLYENDGRLLEIKGDKQSLGYRSSNPDYPFQTHTIAVDKPLRVYLATDGTFDQIAENTGLPVGKRRIRDFLTHICKDPMDAQKQSLANMMEAFQGSEEQRDDITVVGLHLKA